MKTSLHFLRLAAERILDLKRDPRIKYVSLFWKEYGPNAADRNSVIPPRKLYRNHVCPAARPLRTPRRTRIFRRQRDVMFSATSFSRKSARRSA